MQPRLVLNSQSFSLSDPELRITGMRHHTQLESFYPYISFKGCWLEWRRGYLMSCPSLPDYQEPGGSSLEAEG